MDEDGPLVALRNARSRFIAGFHGQWHTRLVLAGDDPEVAHIIDARMRAGGFSTTIAFDGQQAIEAVEREQPDVLVLDSMMRKMTGFNVLHRIRALANKPRVIVLSARGREQDVRSRGRRLHDEAVQSAGAAGPNRPPLGVTELISR